MDAESQSQLHEDAQYPELVNYNITRVFWKSSIGRNNPPKIWGRETCSTPLRRVFLLLKKKKVISLCKKEIENVIQVKFEDYDLGTASQKTPRMVLPLRIQVTVTYVF